MQSLFKIKGSLKILREKKRIQWRLWYNLQNGSDHLEWSSSVSPHLAWQIRPTVSRGNSLTSTRTTDFRRFGPFSNKMWYYDDWIKEGTGKKEVRDREREDIGTLKCRVSVSKAVCGDGVWACVGIKVPLDLHIKRLDPTNHSRIKLLFALCIHWKEW